MERDLRVCFVGDSFVAGAGDPEHLGWVGRLAARSFRAGRSLTAYNLGVRRETSGEVLARWAAECAPRLPAGFDSRVVVSFGVNDTAVEGDQPRVRAADSAAHLATLLSEAAIVHWPALVVGPPPVADEQHNIRTASLDIEFARVCRLAGIGYVSVLNSLRGSDVWMTEVGQGDGSHPGGGGYELMAELVWLPWLTWISRARPADR